MLKRVFLVCDGGDAGLVEVGGLAGQVGEGVDGGVGEDGVGDGLQPGVQALGEVQVRAVVVLAGVGRHAWLTIIMISLSLGLINKYDLYAWG